MHCPWSNRKPALNKADGFFKIIKKPMFGTIINIKNIATSLPRPIKKEKEKKDTIRKRRPEDQFERTKWNFVDEVLQQFKSPTNSQADKFINKKLELILLEIGESTRDIPAPFEWLRFDMIKQEEPLANGFLTLLDARAVPMIALW